MNPGIDENALIIIIWGVAAIVMAWTWVPAFISAFGGTRFSCDGTNNTTGMEPSPAQPDYSFWAEQLLELGYEPLGSGWMRVNFAGPEWANLSAIRVFKNPAKNSFALMQEAPAPFNFWPGAIFVTCLVDGGMLRSDNNMAADPDPDDVFIKQGTVTLRLRKLEAYHRATLEVLSKIGRKPDADLSMETLLHAEKRRIGPEARQAHGRAGTQYLFAHGLIHICVSTPAAYLMGITHWSVPLSNLVLALLILLGENAQKRQYANAVRAALRLKQSLPQEDDEIQK